MEIPDVGVPFKIRVGHDNKGLAAAWHLDNIVLYNIATQCFYTFVANRWLSKLEGDKQIVVELPLKQAESIDKKGNRVAMKVSAHADLVKYEVGPCVCGR